MQNLHGVLTACTRRDHNAPTALKKTPSVATAFPQRAVQHAVQTPIRGVYVEHAQNKRRRMAF